ncbi:MAG: acyl-CoA dehydrogenase family protein, partial [Candidatus Neomarinimicrobiota bacterium]
ARDSCALTRETSRICLGISTAFFALQLGSDPILVGATHEQKVKWLGKIAEGDSIVAYAVTEPGAGSNLAALKTKAEPVLNAAGEITAYKLNGNKQFISNGGYADIITVLANTPEGPAFFVVEKGMPGLLLGKGEEKHGIRASNTSPIVLEDVLVPAENLIGGIPGQGMKQANEVFGYTRLMVAAMALGAAEEALDIATAYAQERIQFGGPLSEKQGYTHKLIVPGAVRLAAGAAYIEQVALKFDSGATGLQEEGSVAKYFVTEVANRAADCCIQALGGYGYINEYQVEKIKRDVRITNIYEGTSEIQQSIISMFRWKKTVKTGGEFYASLAAELDSAHGRNSSLGADTAALATRVLNATIQAIHQHKLTKSQHVMFLLADMVSWVEVTAALTRKALPAAGTPEARKLELMARIMTAETALLVGDKATEILLGSAACDRETFAAFAHTNNLARLHDGSSGLLVAMDQLADIIFDRVN